MKHDVARFDTSDPIQHTNIESTLICNIANIAVISRNVDLLLKRNVAETSIVR